MEELTKLSVDSIIKYFSNLFLLGYKDYNSVYLLISLLFIEEILNGELSMYVDNDDYRTIINALYCMCGSNCMVDFPEYNVYDSIIHKSTNNLHPRLSSDCILRNSQEGVLRKI